MPIYRYTVNVRLQSKYSTVHVVLWSCGMTALCVYTCSLYNIPYLVILYNDIEYMHSVLISFPYNGDGVRAAPRYNESHNNYTRPTSRPVFVN